MTAEGPGRLDLLKLIHFHLGSQITDIRYIKAGLQEVSRYYAELRGLGVDITHVDVGGGLGVDYDGSGSTSQASVNYSLQEYADAVIYTLAEACREHELPMPHIISESGRALTAHHALLLLSVIDVESQADNAVPELSEENHTLLHEMATDYTSVLKRVSRKRVREVYHDATFDKERAQELFNSGVLTLRDRASPSRFTWPRSLRWRGSRRRIATSTRTSSRISRPIWLTATSATFRSSSPCRTAVRSTRSSRSCRFIA